MPVGNYVDLHIETSGYLANTERYLFEKNQISSMLFIPERTTAQILGFADGYVTYNFPNYLSAYPGYNTLDVSFECCSEAPYYRNNWLSDITVSLNGTEVVTFTSPGDFGGRRGLYTPKSWPANSTQFGMLVQVRIDENGVWLNHQKAGSAVVDDFAFLTREKCLRFRLGVKQDAKYAGGLNLFGKNFGDYPQGIRISLDYSDP